MSKDVFICPKCNFNVKTKKYEHSDESDALNNKTYTNLKNLINDMDKAELTSDILDNIDINITQNGETVKTINIKPDELREIFQEKEPDELPFEINEEVLSMDTMSGRKLSEAVDSLLAHPTISKEGKIDMIYSDIYNIGHGYMNNGDFDNAITAYEEVIKIGGDAPIYFIDLTNIYRKRRQWDDEIRICEKAVVQIGIIHKTPYDVGIFESRKDLATVFKIHENDEEGIISQFFDCDTENALKLDIHKRLRELDFNDVEKTYELVSIADYLLRNNIGDDKCLAYYNRVFGEVALFNEDKESAYEYFEKALELDSKVGVKQKYNKLKKELKK